MDTLFVANDLDALSPKELHLRLSVLNRFRFTPGLPSQNWEEQTRDMLPLLRDESAFLERLRADTRDRAAQAPTDGAGFIEWFEQLKETGPGQNDALFPWLAEKAGLDQMCWFLTQEVAGEAGFDDLVALTQIKLPAQAKLELARNYWDEMGRGNAKGMHGPMLETLARALDLHPRPEDTVWEALALANMMSGVAANRRYAFHAVGALGAIELTAPGRSKLVAAGLKRLGVAPDDRHYFDLHAVLDVKHSEAWNKEAIGPLVEQGPDVARAIAEGALMRLSCGERCFHRYRRHFGL